MKYFVWGFIYGTFILFAMWQVSLFYDGMQSVSILHELLGQ